MDCVVLGMGVLQICAVFLFCAGACGLRAVRLGFLPCERAS
jgi:hypothetical protein